ncbi:MAG: PQQ-binding-like beta-propeller repeat protein, partial [Hyphomicrobiaceae bacterium]
QPGGVSSNAPGHLQLQSSVKAAWSADAGEGSSSYGKLTSSPVVYGGRVYTLDAYGNITAFSAAGGKKAWRYSLAPKHENAQEGFGGGLAVADGRIIAATGFGTVVALNPRSGAKLWDVTLGVPVRNSPTAAGGKIFVASIDGRFHALSAEDGKTLWRFDSAPHKASILSNVSPAVAEGIVVVPYLSGDVVAVNAETGETLWTDSLSSSRSRSSVASIGNPGRPVISDGTVFAVGNAGRMIASGGKSGARLWSRQVRSIQTPWVAGDAVYIVDVNGRLMALNRKSGTVYWAAKIPGGGKWSGPVLAGNRLWLASSKGALVGVDAASGRVTSTKDLGQPVYIAPVVAGGRMYVLTDSASLIALR